ncbi:MAG: phosphotransferase family protein [Proteobacteria bacterium]|nr:phosphotransferase family protein [Pseudomonadota bacterium]
MKAIDQPEKIRPGEELDLGRIEAYLKAQIPDLEGRLETGQFPGGHSNLTYYLKCGDREMVLRRPPFGTKPAGAHDMNREYRVLSALHPVYPYGPKPLHLCRDESVMGCPFWVMEKITGIVIRKEMPPGLEYTPEQALELRRDLVEVQYRLHAVDYKAIGLEDFGKPKGYLERQVLGWNKRYRNARTPDAPEAEDVMCWLEAEMPPENDRPGIVHNDFKLDNVALDPSRPARLIGVFDWEMATIGDPLMDLCNSLVYVLDPDDPPEMEIVRYMPRQIDDVMTRAEMTRYYETLSGQTLDRIDYYYALSLFRLGVIIQQIYYRFYHGQTRDQRFKTRIRNVHALVQAAQRVIAHSGR